MSASRGFTVFFSGSLRAFPGNPFKTETPFGLPEIVGHGNAFWELDDISEQLDLAKAALREALPVLLVADDEKVPRLAERIQAVEKAIQSAVGRRA